MKKAEKWGTREASDTVRIMTDYERSSGRKLLMVKKKKKRRIEQKMDQEAPRAKISNLLLSHLWNRMIHAGSEKHRNEKSREDIMSWRADPRRQWNFMSFLFFSFAQQLSAPRRFEASGRFSLVITRWSKRTGQGSLSPSSRREAETLLRYQTAV